MKIYDNENIDAIKRKTLSRDILSWKLKISGTIIENIWTIVFLCLPIYLLSIGTMDISKIILFITYSRVFSSSIKDFFTQYMGLQSHILSVSRVLSIIDSYTPCLRKDVASELQGEIKSITFENIQYSYGDCVVFSGFSEVITGKVTLVIGPNGAGKSTLLHLIAGALNLYKGDIKSNGIPLSRIGYSNMQSIVTFFSQDDILFDISVRDNIYHLITERMLVSSNLYLHVKP